MVRICIICEGQTEEMFVNEVLAEPFANKGLYLTAALIGKPGHKGGAVNYQRLKTDVRNFLKSDREILCSTFFDYYGLSEDFPGKSQQNIGDISQKAHAVEMALTETLIRDIPDFQSHRFIPHVQMYEFEGLLFSAPIIFANAIGQDHLNQDFQNIRQQFNSPEHINDSPQTAPSKRVEALYSAYQKPTHGIIAAQEIGLNLIREQCQQFNAWLQKLEALI